MKTSAFTIPSVNIQLGKRKQRSQMCEVFTDDGNIVRIEVPVLRGCCADYQRNAAYIIDHENQYTAEDGNSTQICSERSCIPMCMRIPKNFQDLKTLINEIFAASYEASKRQQFIDALKDKWEDKILWIVSIPFSALLAIFLINKL